MLPSHARPGKIAGSRENEGDGFGCRFRRITSLVRILIHSVSCVIPRSKCAQDYTCGYPTQTAAERLKVHVWVSLCGFQVGFERLQCQNIIPLYDLLLCTEKIRLPIMMFELLSLSTQLRSSIRMRFCCHVFTHGCGSFSLLPLNTSAGLHESYTQTALLQ